MKTDSRSLLHRLREVSRTDSLAARELFFASLLTGGPEVGAVLEAALLDNGPRVQMLALEALRALHGPRVAPILVRALKGPDVQLRRIAAGELEALGNAAVPELCGLLRHDDWDVRVRAAEALGRLHAAAAVSGLCRLLRDRHELVRIRAARALGEIGEVAAAQHLREALADDSEGVRTATAGALARLGNREAIGDLVRILERRPGVVLRRAAVSALLDLGWNPREAAPELRIMAGLTLYNHALILPLGRSAVLELCDWMRQDEGEMRARAIEALGHIARQDPGGELQAALPLLRAMFRSREAVALRSRLRATLRAIEHAVGVADLPLPSAATVPSADNLPRPAPVIGPNPTKLPVPAGSGSVDPLGDRRRQWLICWAWWTWR